MEVQLRAPRRISEPLDSWHIDDQLSTPYTLSTMEENTIRHGLGPPLS